MLFAMGAGDRVIAIGSYDHFPPEAQKLPRVGALIDPNVEQILQMRPDLVVLYGTQTELKRRLERANIPYYSYVHKGLSDITDDDAVARQRASASSPRGERAGRAASSRQLADIRERVSDAAAPEDPARLRARAGARCRNIYASGGEGFLHDMLVAAGGADVIGDIHRQSVTMSTEMVLDRAPEIIVELRYSADDINDSDISAWNTLASVPAVKNRRVILLTGEEFVVPGPRVAEATRRLAQALHPEVRW